MQEKIKEKTLFKIKESFPYILLFLFIFIFFYDVFILKLSFFGRDYSTIQLPLKAHTFSILKKGFLPLWSKNVFAGYPFFASGEHGILYPLSLIFLIAPSYIIMSYFALLHLLLPAIFTCFFLRKCKVGIVASFVGSFAIFYFFKMVFFEASVISPLIWLPLLVYIGEKMLTSKKTIYPIGKQSSYGVYFLIFVLIESFVFLTGHQQYAYVVNIPLFLYLFIFHLVKNKDKHLVKNILIFFTLYFGAIFLAFLISSVQIIPQFELYLKSSRYPEIGYKRAVGPPIDINSLKSLFTNVVVYLFLIAVYLSIFDKRRIRPKIFAFITFFLFLLVIHSPDFLYKIFYNFLPGFKSMRGTDKFLHSLFFFLSFQIAMSIDFFIYLLSVKLQKKFFLKYFLIGSFPLIFFLIAFSGFKKIPLKLKKNKTFSELSYLDGHYFEKGQETYFLVPVTFYKQINFISFLKKDKDKFRVVNNDWSKGPLKPNENLIFNIELFDGHFPLPTKNFYNLFLVDAQPNPLGYVNRNIANLFNIKYLLSFKKEKIKNTKLEYIGKKIFIYENLDVFPRAFLVGKYKVITDLKKQNKMLRESTFNPRKTVLLEKKINFKLDDIKKSDYKIKFLNSPSPQEIKFHLKTKKHSILVLSSSYNKDWKVFVDGKQREIFRTYSYIMGVFIEKGEHNVVFVFSPFYVRIGFYISFFSFLFIFLLFFLTVSGNIYLIQ
jgi:hypothetical protein